MKDLGLIPPHSKEVEELVLGAIIKEDTAIHRVIDIIKVDTFYYPEHQYIFEAAETLFKKSRPVNIVTIHEELKAADHINAHSPIDIPYLSNLVNMVANTSTLEQHVHYIEEKAIARRTIGISMRTIEECYKPENDIFEVLAKADQESYEARNSITGYKNVTMDHIVDDFFKHIESVRDKKGLIGLPTGLHRLDELTGGLQGGQLITIAARPAMGKSAVASYFQYQHAISGNPSAYFSLEMNQRELMSRICSMALRDRYQTKVDYEQIIKRTYPEEQHELVCDVLSDCKKLPIYIDDTKGMSTTQIKAKIMKFRNDFGITSAYIDYLQLMPLPSTGRGDNRAAGISQICTDFKSMAGAFDMPVISMSQVDREVGKPGKIRMPTIADMKESGGIEEKSDMIITLFRPDALADTDYDIHEDDHDAMYLMVAKQKMGKTGLMKFPFDIGTNWFEDYSRPEQFTNYVPNFSSPSDDSYSPF